MRRRWWTLGAGALVVVAALVGWWQWPGGTASTPPAARARPSAPPALHPDSGPCGSAPRRPFVPTSVVLAGRSVRVRPVPRTPEGVMGVLPETDKTEMATDLGGVEAGAAHGRLLLNTHTWPDGSALGNRLLARLRPGARLVVSGHGRTQCYRVFSRQQVLASNGYPGWDRRRGTPQAVIIVCSGRRLGPGDWTDRTLWFARPYLGGRPAA